MNIDQAKSEFSNSKAFVRPSGTENILRLYVEGKDEEELDLLTEAIKLELFMIHL